MADESNFRLRSNLAVTRETTLPGGRPVNITCGTSSILGRGLGVEGGGSGGGGRAALIDVEGGGGG